MKMFKTTDGLLFYNEDVANAYKKSMNKREGYNIDVDPVEV